MESLIGFLGPLVFQFDERCAFLFLRHDNEKVSVLRRGDRDVFRTAECLHEIRNRRRVADDENDVVGVFLAELGDEWSRIAWRITRTAFWAAAVPGMRKTAKRK
ncbi:MAG: hypothetical protein WCC53_13655 [Thermoanaerobaculia bacterium]